jgi:CMP-N-acetylneuraminate monooxygenase
MKKLGKFNEISQETKIEVNLDELKVGFNSLQNHIISIDENGNVLSVIDKVCDHAGGRLILKGNNAVCPMHNWNLNLKTLQYNDSHVCKEQADYKTLGSKKIQLHSSKNHLENPFVIKKSKNNATLRWLNHACVYIECNGVSFITDPWLFGPAFMTGWWLDEPSTTDSTELLKSADFIYISHNHPDHLHPETLGLVPKDKKIIVANFNSNSSEKYLKALGFSNIISLDYNEIFEITQDFQISILKSGDFRDDSGIYFNLNGQEILLTVDCNYLNSNVLPNNLDLLMTSFAGGASGFPLCFEDYDLNEKTNIVKRNKISIRASVTSYLQATQPKFYMPYAGMFKEYASRDEFIQKNNVKNSTEDYEPICEKFGTKYLEPKKNQILEFSDERISLRQIEVNYLNKEKPSFYINNYKSDFVYSAEKTIQYLTKSGFHGKQIVQIIPTNDSFDEVTGDVIYADFNSHIYKTLPQDKIIAHKEGYKVMQLRIRKEIIACVVENKLPWEDFSIGFQMRVIRIPNEYESDFWYHFTNVYINSDHFRYSSFCGACSIINQNPIWNKINATK